MRVFIKENPRQAAYIGGGAALGYYTSGDGVVNTVVGTGLGAAAGAYGAGLGAANAARIALQTERVVAAQRMEILACENQSIRSTLEMTQQGYAAALARGAKPVVEKIGLEVKNIQSSSSMLEQAKGLWSLWRFPKPSASSESVFHILASAAR